MKTKIQVIRENEGYKSLISAVINNIGMDSVMDVVNYGIDGGYSGFIYYSDTHKFAIRHRKDIVLMLEDSASSLGEDIISMVANFGVFRNSAMDNDDRRDLYKYLGGGKPEQGTITNLMAFLGKKYSFHP